MAAPELVMPEYVGLKNHPDINEKWLQERLIENPDLLGLDGELEVRDSERGQPSGGRLDLLLADIESGIRYEVEIQLGDLDESHIIRTIEYWDIERRRYPQYEHIAVIVAEEVTGRFHNVISLLNSNGSIPLIAIQIKGVEVNGAFTLVATRVVDLIRLGTDEEDDAGEPVDRSSWEAKASLDSLKIMDCLVEMVREVEPDVIPQYNKRNIGLEYNGQDKNFVRFVPRKKGNYVVTQFKIPQNEETTALLQESDLDILKYSSVRYRVRIFQRDLHDARDVLLELIRTARDFGYRS
ncbi:MAG: hypothetical protein OXC95_12075 [Dehalococcoidia bacterium]|nr:hypothetical protein [Dehalococcoidia bacterium]